MDNSGKPLYISIGVFVLLLAIGLFFVSIVEADRQEHTQKALTEIATGESQNIVSLLDHLLSATFALATTVRQSKGVVTDFPALARDTMKTYPGVKNLQLAPKDVIGQIYPLEGNENAIGHNLLTDHRRRGEALSAIKTKKLTLAGPFTLIQGGEAIIGRLPVFLPDEKGRDRFWGFTIVLIAMSDFMDEINLNRLQKNGYEYQLWRRDPETGERRVFAQSANARLENPVGYRIDVPNGAWYLSLAEDKEGRLPILLWLESGVAVLIGALVSVGVNRTLTHSAELQRAVNERTSELKRTFVELERENVRRQRAKELSDAINNINSLTVQAGMNYDGIMDSVVRKAGEAIGCEKALIAMKDNDSWVIEHIFRYPASLIGKRLTGDDAPELSEAATTKTPVIVVDTSKDARVNHAAMQALGIKSLMVLPLVVRERVEGVLSFYYHTRPANFTQDEIDFSSRLAAALSLAIENHRLHANRGELLKTLQEALLAVPESIPGLEFGHFYSSATEHAEVGGDFYEIFEPEDNFVAILVGDVSGHGIEAANVAALVKNTIRAFGSHDLSPARVIKRTSEVVRKATDPSVFVTAFFGILDKQQGTFTYCNAGHPPAAVVRGTDVTWLEANSGIVGAIYDTNFTARRVKLTPRDICVIYTDGVVEARKNKEMFGEERLAEAIFALPDICPLKAPSAIAESVEKFTSGKFVDDIAIVAFSPRKNAV